MKINIKNYMAYKYYNRLLDILKDYQNKEIIFFCVGNYKIWFDCFAPLFAEILRTKTNSVYIFGGVNYPITPENLVEYMDFIKDKYPAACVIVVDNCITLDPNCSGEVVINKRSTIPAGLINSRAFGDVSILLKTYPKEDCYTFLHKQYNLANMLSDVFLKLSNNM